jgi:ketosteroid isomerase-like protein
MDTFSARRWQSVLAACERHPRRCLLAMAVALCSLMVVGAPGVRGQEGTPTAGLDVPAPAECTVEPRSEDELRTLFREVAATPVAASPEASPTPAVPPAGAPADEQTETEINATWRQYMACITAGDQARMFALLSDDMVQRQFAVDVAFGVSEDALFAFLAATPVPLLPDQAVPFVPIADVRVLSDGRVAVVGPGERGRGDVRIFVKEGDRWVVDDWFELT